MSNVSVVSVMAQNILEAMVKRGDPQQWESPYLVKRSSSHVNFTTGKRYIGGLNNFALNWSGTGERLWAGKAQAAKMGLKIRAQHYDDYVIILSPMLNKFEVDDAAAPNGKREVMLVRGFKYTQVWPISSFEGEKLEAIKAKYITKQDVGPIDEDELAAYQALEAMVVEELDIPVEHTHDHVAYSEVVRCQINMPRFETLKAGTASVTLLHETGHALKHKGAKAMDNRPMEEAVAEFFSVITAEDLNIEADVTNAMAYIWSWLQVPKGAFSKKGNRSLTNEELTIRTMLTTAIENAIARQKIMSGLRRKAKHVEDVEDVEAE